MGKRALVLGVMVGLFGASSAQAATFCVPDPGPACSGTDANTIALALTAANGSAGRDTIRIAPGTYTEDGLEVVDNNPVDIIGAGESTVITRSNDGAVITLREGSVLSDVKITIPAGVNNNAVNGQDDGGRIERVLVTDSPANSSSEAIFGNVDVVDSTVLVTTGGSGGTAIFTTNENFVRGSHLEGVYAVDGAGLVEDSTAVAVRGFRVNDNNEDVVVRDVLLQLDDGINPRAFEVDTENSASVDVRNATVIGSGDAVFDDVAVWLLVETDFADSVGEVKLRNVVLHDVDQTFVTFEDAGVPHTATASVDVAYSSFDPDPTKQEGPGDLVLGPGNIFANPPGFVSATDFRPASCTSPLVDAGEPVGTEPGDVDASKPPKPRSVAAKSQVVTTDIGAFEFQYTPPTSSITASGNPPFVVGENIQFSANVLGGDGGPFAAAWTFDDGTSATDVSPTHAFSSAGTHGVQVAIAPVSGCLGAAAALQVEVGALPRRVSLTRFRMTRRRFRVGKKRTPKVAARAPVGTTFIYSIDRPATARIRIDRLRKGKRPKRAGTLRRRIRSAGQVRTPFSGRIGRKALKPGRYRATISASASGSQTSLSRRLTFTVVR